MRGRFFRSYFYFYSGTRKSTCYDTPTARLCRRAYRCGRLRCPACCWAAARGRSTIDSAASRRTASRTRSCRPDERTRGCCGRSAPPASARGEHVRHRVERETRAALTSIPVQAIPRALRSTPVQTIPHVLGSSSTNSSCTRIDPGSNNSSCTQIQFKQFLMYANQPQFKQFLMYANQPQFKQFLMYSDQPQFKQFLMYSEQPIPHVLRSSSTNSSRPDISTRTRLLCQSNCAQS